MSSVKRHLVFGLLTFVVCFLTAFRAAADTEVVDGVSWSYVIESGRAVIGRGKPAISNSTIGKVRIPSTLGGYVVRSVGSQAFMNCSVSTVVVPETVDTLEDFCFAFCWNLNRIEFWGNEPNVGTGVFMYTRNCTVLVSRFANWSCNVPGVWNELPVEFGPSYNSSLVVTTDKEGPNVDFSGKTTLTLTPPAGCTIYYTCDGLTPTDSSLVYTGPILIRESMMVRFIAYDADGNWGPVGSVTLQRVPGLNDELTTQPLSPDGTRFIDSLTVGFSVPSGLSVWYTTDGTDPLTSATRRRYTGTFSINERTLITYCACDSVSGDHGPVETVEYYRRLPDGGPYTETVGGVTWRFRIQNGYASLGYYPYDYTGLLYCGISNTAVTKEPTGRIVMPSILGGAEVRYVAPMAFDGDFLLDYVTELCVPKTLVLDSCKSAGFSRSKIVCLHDLGNWCQSSVSKILASPEWWGDYPQGRVLCLNDEVVSQLSIPDSVSFIQDCAFRSFSSISNLIVGHSVTNIGRSAFGSCSSLKTVYMPDNVQTIDELAFYDCSALSSVRLSKSITKISNGVFRYCSSLGKVDIPETVSVLGDYAFESCSSLSEIMIPSSVSKLGSRCFNACSRLARVYMSGDAPIVGQNTFSGVSDYCTIYVNHGTSGWGSVPGVWNGLPVRYAEDAAYTDVPGGLWTTGIYDTSGAASLRRAGLVDWEQALPSDIAIPVAWGSNEITSLGSRLFQGVSHITSVSIPAGVNEIQDSVFDRCTRLKEIVLPEGLASIGDNAFRECTSLESVTIPASVTNIGYFAFRDCLRLTNVTLKGEAPRQDLGVYMGVPAFTVISGRLGAATAIVYAEVTNSTDTITVPESWLEELAAACGTPAGAASYQEAFEEKFGSDLSAALTMPTGKYDLHGNPILVWQDYVAGTNPLDEEDVFTATITMVDGLPVISWSPELSPERAALRQYTVYGATVLGGEWVDVSEKTAEERYNEGFLFFKVVVQMK